MPFFVKSGDSKAFNISTMDIEWQYTGPKTNAKTNPTKVYAQLSDDADKLIADILSGNPQVLAEFEYAVPGNPRNWDTVLKRPLKPRDDNFSGDNVKYDTPELRSMLAKQVRAFFPRLFSKNPYMSTSNTVPTEQRLESLGEYMPETLFNTIMSKYNTLRDVNKNKNINGRKLTPEQISTEAEADVIKIKAAVEKYFASAKPIVDNEYGRQGLKYDKTVALKAIPTVKQLADARAKKANIVKAVNKLNPVSKAVAKMAIKRNPAVVNTNSTFVKMVLKKEPEKPKYEGFGDYKSKSGKW